MRTWTRCLAVVCALAAAGCAMPGPRVPATRQTPQGTLEVLKNSVRRGDRAGEWDLLSPDLKRRISSRAGRNVDLGDYVTARESYRRDPQIRQAEGFLQTARITRVQNAGPNRVRARMNIAGPFGMNAWVTMVRLDRWVLTVKDEAEPYYGFMGDQFIGIQQREDGGYEVWTRDQSGNETSRLEFLPDQVVSYRVVSEWYFDDLGGLENQFVL